MVLIEAEKKGASSLAGLLGAFEKEALAAGAKTLQIAGLAVVNPKLANPQIAAKFGYVLQKLSDGTIILTKQLVP